MASGFGMRMLLTLHVPGTMTADVTLPIALPHGCTLEEVSVGCTANPAGVELTKSAASIMAQVPAGVGDAEVYGKAYFQQGGLTNVTPHFDAGDVLTLFVDYDWNGDEAPAACADLTVVLTLREG